MRVNAWHEYPVRTLVAVVGMVFGVVGLEAVGLEAQVETGREGVVSLDGARIFYEVVGTGAPIVIVHGGPGLDHGYLRPGLDVLAARNTLVYYDQRGTGKSDVALDTTGVNFNAFVDDIDALRQALGFAEITVLGHSFGTLFAIEYARRYPASVHSVILMNPTEPGSRFREQTNARLANARTDEDSAELMELTASAAFSAREVEALSAVYRVAFRGTFKDRGRVDELDLTLSDKTARNGQDVGRLLGQSLGPVEWWDRLGDIRAPTLVVHGRYDIPPVAMAEALADAFPDGSLAVLDSGHFPYIEDAVGLAAAITGFLEGTGR